MRQITQVKEKLLAEIEVLPEHRLPEVLDFVSFLRTQEAPSTTPVATVSAQDPFLQYIGGVEHGTLAHNIDEDLYES